MIQRILVVDDDVEALITDGVKSGFRENGIDLVCHGSKDSAVAFLKSGVRVDGIILDWHLEVDSDMLSKLFLIELKKLRFIPVLVWSGHLDVFTGELDEGKVDFPKSLIAGVDKSKIDPEHIREKITEKIEGSISNKVASVYRKMIHKSLEATFYELASIGDIDLQSYLIHLLGSQTDVDWSNDFILNRIHRSFLRDDYFQNEVSNMLKGDPSFQLENSHEKKEFANQVLYFKSNGNGLRSGDIVKIEFVDELQFGIVVTPDCDLFQKKTRILEIVELKRMPESDLAINSSDKGSIKKYNHEAYYPFPHVKFTEKPGSGGFCDFLAVFKSKLILRQEVLKEGSDVKFPKAFKRLEYSDSFDFSGESIKIEYICSIDNPYKSDFLHALHAHNGRVGTPNIRALSDFQF